MSDLTASSSASVMTSVEDANNDLISKEIIDEPMLDANSLANILDPALAEIENSVSVSIEPNHESEILEIKYDGTEIYKQPPSYSDNLAQLISKIDFNELDEIKSADATGQLKSAEKNEEMTAKKFHQLIYEKVKLSLDEVSVLLDCLKISNANKLLTIEHGRENLLYSDDRQNESMDKTFGVILKKKNIEKSKSLLKKSLEKISNEQESSHIKFHFELYRARQVWRIKKIGNKFNCDLSYRSVGCVNAIKVNLELFKNDLLPSNPENGAKHQYLSVIIPDELKDYAYIQVKIVKTTKKEKKQTLFDSKFSLFRYSSNTTGWQEVLEREQNSIYCKEIYYKLLREIFDPNSTLPSKPIISGNSIQIMINDEHDLIISLVHTTEKNFANQQCPKGYNFDNAILEYYLHCLLKKSFDQNFFHYDQKPITATLAYNTQVKIAGMAYANLNFDDEDSVISLPHNIIHLLNKKKKINLLLSIKEKAEHLIIRKKILKILKNISKKVSEPHVFIEQPAWNSATSTDISVVISSYQFELLARSFFYITIKQSQVSVINRSINSSISFTDSVDDLKDYFLDQCTFHQINLIVTLSQSFGWTLLGSTFTNELNNKHLTGMALIYNNKYSKKIGIKVGPVNEFQIYVNQYNVANQANVDPNLRSLLGDMSVDWIFIKDNYASVCLDTYPGVTKMQKFELFLAQYSTVDII